MNESNLQAILRAALNGTASGRDVASALAALVHEPETRALLMQWAAPSKTDEQRAVREHYRQLRASMTRTDAIAATRAAFPDLDQTAFDVATSHNPPARISRRKKSGNRFGF
jgi:hypothetical protein